MWKETPTISFSTQLRTTTKQPVKIAEPKGEPSERELQVLQLMANGKSSKHIADTLCLSIDTVESHRKTLYKKINVSNATGAVAWGFRKKLIK